MTRLVNASSKCANSFQPYGAPHPPYTPIHHPPYTLGYEELLPNTPEQLTIDAGAFWRRCVFRHFLKLGGGAARPAHPRLLLHDVFKPKLNPPDMLDVTETRTIEKVREKVLNTM